jgi:hypothetical protein
MGKYSRRDFMKAGAVLGTTSLVGGSPQGEKIRVDVTLGTATRFGQEVVTCRPWVAELLPGSQVAWSSEHPFAIHFAGIAPAGIPAAIGDKGHPFVMTIPDSTCLLGHFKYFVAVYNGAKVLTADPDIIIDPKGDRPKG